MIKKLLKKANTPVATAFRWNLDPLMMRLRDVKKIANANELNPAKLAAQILDDSEHEPPFGRMGE
jgi:soluble cytochrome b562